MSVLKKYCLFIGRWQPFHNGHKWLIDQQLSKGKPICIAIRDIDPDENNPMTAGDSALIINWLYKKEDVKVIIIPDIESVNYGRGVGYDIIEHEPPDSIHLISATQIREQLDSGSDAWKSKIDPEIHDLVSQKLG